MKGRSAARRAIEDTIVERGGANEGGLLREVFVVKLCVPARRDGRGQWYEPLGGVCRKWEVKSKEE